MSGQQQELPPSHAAHLSSQEPPWSYPRTHETGGHPYVPPPPQQPRLQWQPWSDLSGYFVTVACDDCRLLESIMCNGGLFCGTAVMSDRYPSHPPLHPCGQWQEQLPTTGIWCNTRSNCHGTSNYGAQRPPSVLSQHINDRQLSAMNPSEPSSAMPIPTVSTGHDSSWGAHTMPNQPDLGVLPSKDINAAATGAKFSTATGAFQGAFAGGYNAVPPFPVTVGAAASHSFHEAHLGGGGKDNDLSKWNTCTKQSSELVSCRDDDMSELAFPERWWEDSESQLNEDQDPGPGLAVASGSVHQPQDLPSPITHFVL